MNNSFLAFTYSKTSGSSADSKKSFDLPIKGQVLKGTEHL